jgi:hypothetical protein
MKPRNAILLLLLIAAVPAPARAQRVDNSLRMQDTTRVLRANWRPMRIVKWTALLASGGAAAYGFAQNRVADRDYHQLELECEEAPASCIKLAGSESYANPALEQRYQRILERDENARTALLAGQIGIAASVIMFIIDLPDRESPEDIPYEPRPLRVGLGRGGAAQLEVRLRAF